MLSDNSVYITEKEFPKTTVDGVYLNYTSDVYCKTYYTDSDCSIIHRDGDLPALCIYNQDDELTVELWCQYGKVHRENGPAFKTYYKGVVSRASWFRDGRLHREDDEPASIWYDQYGGIVSENWAVNDEFHREGNKPAIIRYYSDSSIYNKWYKNGELHRENDKPADIQWAEDCKKVYYKKWFKNGQLHRENDQPAYIQYDEFSVLDNVIQEDWYKNNRRHRENGPASILYDEEDGTIRSEKYYKNGVQVLSQYQLMSM